jgi:hypothetical protein
VTRKKLSRRGKVVRAVAVLAVVLAPTAYLALPSADASTGFTVGVPTVVDPIRGAGEPDIAVDNNANALVTGPGGTGSQTSWFWKTQDHGLTYPLIGPSGGHPICPAGGGGDSLAVIDHKANTTYLTDQLALADIGSGVLQANGSLTTACVTAPAVTADRPFEAVIPSGTATAPVSVADPGKPIVYLSYLCDACAGSGDTAGGLAFGWSDDGLTFHPADPGALIDNPAANAFTEASAINAFQWHGSMVADPRTGWVYTGIACTTSSGCPNGETGHNEVGVAVGKADPAKHPTNIGEFDTVDYRTVSTPADATSLFPVLTMDSAGTLYELWTQGDANASITDPLSPTAWHIYYAYSKDTPDHAHTTWSKPIRVDHDKGTSVFGWVVAGDAGKLGFVWLQSQTREHPSKPNADKVWHPVMAMTTNATAASPSFKQAVVGDGPNHIGDICLQGTVGCIENVGNRNMADFISVDVNPSTGALQATWANDANQLATLPTTLIPGLPITETAIQTGGDRLIGTGKVIDKRFSTASQPQINDANGDARFPVGSGANVPGLDIVNSDVRWTGADVQVGIDLAGSTGASPDATKPNSWFLTVWQFDHRLYFAKAQIDGTGSVTYTAGAPKSFDRVGLNGQTVATLTDFSGGTTVRGTRTANGFRLTIPSTVVGNPTTGTLFEAVTAYTALDNGAPPEIGPGVGNVPTIVDATPSRNVVLSGAAQAAPTPWVQVDGEEHD